MPHHSWQESYAAEMVELDLACVPGRIEAAQAAIRQAMKDLAGTPECSTAEMPEMSSALGSLQLLQTVTRTGSTLQSLDLLQTEELLMQRWCRKTTAPVWRRRQLAMTELLRCARVVTDPKTLACLNAKVATRKSRTESDTLDGKRGLPL